MPEEVSGLFMHTTDVVINAFVGGMVGLERTIIPQPGKVEFGLEAKTAIFSFIVVFGVTKAFTNYYTGTLFNRFGRKNLLVIGWLFALPVPFLLIYATSWNWIIAANIFLGINQGLAWSSTVVMKIDLVGEKSRGFAMGLNEFAGYVALAMIAFATGWVANEYGLRPYPFYIGIGIAVTDYTHPDQRPNSIGIFRLWRDLGYAFGAIFTGLIADRFGLTAPILAIGLLTITSSLIIKNRMDCRQGAAETLKLQANGV